LYKNIFKRKTKYNRPNSYKKNQRNLAEEPNYNCSELYKIFLKEKRNTIDPTHIKIIFKRKQRTLAEEPYTTKEKCITGGPAQSLAGYTELHGSSLRWTLHRDSGRLTNG
jgi:hypothetical protein